MESVWIYQAEKNLFPFVVVTSHSDSNAAEISDIIEIVMVFPMHAPKKTQFSSPLCFSPAEGTKRARQEE